MADIGSGFPGTLTSVLTLRRPLAQAPACWVGLMAAAALALHLACGGGSSSLAPTPPSAPSRSFALGFTDFPHARSVEAVRDAWAVIARDADMAAMHFDDGVPWPEALAGSPYPSSFAETLDFKARSIPSGHLSYLAVTPIAFERNRLADRRGSEGSQPLPPPWDRRGFEHPEVVGAFTAHCERMIAAFSPRYFAYGIEVNMLASLAPAEWPGFLRLVATVYPALKARHPALPIFLTFQADFFHADRAMQTEVVRSVLPFTDFVAVSTYPFTQDAEPRALRPDHFEALAGLAPAKPFAVAETAWPAEDVTAPYPVFIPASDEAQRLYVERLLAEADRLAAVFVTWFFTRDYDAFWEAELRSLPSSALVRLWKDTGLYAGYGRARPALDPWRRALARPRTR